MREDGLPDVFLALFAEELLKSLSSSFVPIYMREVVLAFNGVVEDKVVVENQWSPFVSPVEVRNVVRQCLTGGARCKLRRPPTYIRSSEDLI